MKTCRGCKFAGTQVLGGPCRECLAIPGQRPHWQPRPGLLVDGVPVDIELPLQHQPTGVEAEVCADIARRQALGVAKYGTTVAENPLTHQQWLQHAYEEALDFAVYLKRAMRGDHAGRT